MPDLRNFTITSLSNATLSVPRVQLSGQVVSSDAEARVLADFTGTNAVTFPTVLSSLAAADRRELVEMITMWLLAKRGLL